jgi:hypothetical protein
MLIPTRPDPPASTPAVPVISVAPVTVLATVPVQVTTEAHITYSSLYKFTDAIGSGILFLNFFFIGNPQYVVFAAAKYVWIGPLVSLIGRAADAVQTWRQRQSVAIVHDHTPPVSTKQTDP